MRELMQISPSANDAPNTRAPALASHPQYKWWVVLMLWAICFFNYADRQAIFSVFPLLEREMQLTPVELGLLGSAFAWVYGLGAPFAGMVVDRVTRKTAILGGLHVWSVICAATALSRNVRHLISSALPRGWERRSTSRPRCRSSPIITATARDRARWGCIRPAFTSGLSAAGSSPV